MKAIWLDRVLVRAEMWRMQDASLDPAEIEKFSALAAEWWNPAGPFGALHRLNPVRLSFIRDVVMGSNSSPASGGGAERSEAEGVSTPAPRARGPLAGLSVLDLGCGGGLVSAPLARMGANVVGVDASPEAIGAACAYAAQAGMDIDYRCTTAEALAESGARFDLVTALEIVEHVADVRAFLSAASALVKPGGLLILSTINRTPKARALAIVGAERILQWAPEGAHEYDKLVTPDEIRAGAPDLNWDEPVGVSYNPLGRGWTLSRDTDVNYIIAGRKSAATRSPV